MPYNYADERANLFTDDGQKMLLAVRDKTFGLLRIAGACRSQEMTAGLSGNSWTMLACVDRLVELGDIREVTDPKKTWGQHRVFVAVERG